MIMMRSDPDRLETWTLVHVAALAVLSSWFLGGGSSPARFAICGLGSLAPLLSGFGLIGRHRKNEPVFRPLIPLLPWFGFNAIVVLSLFHPSLRTASLEGLSVFIPVAVPEGWPTSARPELAVRELWLVNSIVLSAFNLTLNVRTRHALRRLFLLLAANALVLAVFGTLQQFIQSDGIYFGRVSSPNPTFFASFIYHNHWGAFAVLSLALCLGLAFDARDHGRFRDFWHSPGPLTVLVVFLLFLTIPLSGARACTLIAFVLLAYGALLLLWKVAVSRRRTGRSILLPGLGMLALATALLVSTYLLARDVVDARLVDTREQLASLKAEGGAGSRGILYRDTLRMITDNPWFGHGLGSYGTVFRSYNTQTGNDGLPQYYEYAHSDWLQLVAETGIMGALCFILFLSLALWPLCNRSATNTLSACLMGGCILILIYATFEFPLANPAVSLLFWICLMGSIRWGRLAGKVPNH